MTIPKVHASIDCLPYNGGKPSDCWVLIPVKPPGMGKTRLAAVLDDTAREQLVNVMLNRVIAAASACPAVTRILVVSAHDRNLTGAETLRGNCGMGLNETLRHAVAHLPTPVPKRIIIVPGDLPFVRRRDFNALASLAGNEAAVAPDHSRQGTNALSLPTHSAAAFRFAFGPRSYERHTAEARRLGLETKTAISRGLQSDVDVPADLGPPPFSLATLLEL